MTATPTLAPTVPAERHSHVAGALRSEWTKLRTVRSTIWTVLITVVLGIGFSVISVLAAKSRFSGIHNTSNLQVREFFDPTSVAA